MIDEKYFLRNICENPSEMGPRLVFSDWLEERGDPHAEYIRSSIELSLWGSSERPRAYGNWNIDCRNRPDWKGTDDSCTIPPNPWRKHCEYHELRFRCAALLAEHRAVWTMAGLPPAIFYDEYGIVFRGCYTAQGIKADFARGFPEILTLRFEEWQRHYETLRDAMPVREVRLTTPVDTEIGPPWKMRIPGGKWHEIKYHGSLGEDEDIQARTSSLLAAEFPGHDAARPIRYTLPHPTLNHGTISATDANGNTTSIPVFPYRAETSIGGIP